MNELLKLVLSLSFSGSLLICLLFLCRLMFQGRLSRRFQYYIWLIVIARLLLPFAPESNLTGNLFRRMEAGLAQTETAALTDRAVQPGGSLLTDNTSQPGGEAPAGLRNAAGNRTGAPDVGPSESGAPGFKSILAGTLQNLWFVWLLGVVALLIRKITVYQSFVKYIQAGQTEITDFALWERFGRIMEQTGIKTSIPVYTNSLIASPLLIGIFRPCIYLPTADLPEPDFEYTIRHELIHYKRRDMLYKWLAQFTVCIHWFNPLVRLMCREINRSCELSCDEAFLRNLDAQGRRAYGNTLLNAAYTGGSYNSSASSVTLYEGPELLKERLESIMKFKKRTRLTLIASPVLAFALCAASAAAGAYAAAPAPETPVPSETTVGEKIEQIKQEYTFYSQEGYYQAPYLFEIGRNLSEQSAEFYSDQTALTLSDNTTIVVYFDEACGESRKDENAMAALRTLLETLKKEYTDSAIPLERPLVVSVQDIGGSDLNQLAEEYYSNGTLTGFAAIYPALGKELQAMYCSRMYADEKIAFFSSVLEKMDDETLNLYAEKSYHDNKVNFFSTIVPFLNEEAVQYWTARSSQDHKINFLSVLVSQFEND